MPVRTEAIVLRLVDFSNTSRVLALYELNIAVASMTQAMGRM